MKDIKKHIILITSLLLITFPLTIQILDRNNMSNNVSIRFTDSYGNKIANTYYEGSNNYGIMIFHGMGEDQRSLNMYASKFVRNGFHVITTDFAGHGRSSGTIPSGNNASDILAEQVLLAKEKFKQQANLNDDQIFYIGHSMGARAITRAMVLESNHVKGGILIGAALSINTTSADWTSTLNSTNPATNILIITGGLEDVLPPEEARVLYNHFSKNNLTDQEARFHDYINADNQVKSLAILKGLTHTYESISIRAVNKALSWVNAVIAQSIKQSLQTNDNYWYDQTNSLSIYDLQFYLIIIEVIGLIIALITGSQILNLDSNSKIDHLQTEELDVTKNKNIDSENVQNNLKKFLLFKPLIWVGSSVIAILIMVLFYFLPVPTPYFTLIFIGPIAGYGLFSIILYRLGKMPGMTNKWRLKEVKLAQRNTWNEFIVSFSSMIFLVIILVMIFSSILYFIFPINIRLVWLVVFSILGTFGFYIIQLESDLLEQRYPEKKWSINLYDLTFLLPFIVGVFYLLISGSIIFLVDGIHDILLLTIILFYGKFQRKISENRLLIAFLQSLIFFLVLLPRGQLI